MTEAETYFNAIRCNLKAANSYRHTHKNLQSMEENIHYHLASQEYDLSSKD